MITPKSGLNLTRFQLESLGQGAYGNTMRVFVHRCQAYLVGVEPMVVLAIAKALGCELGKVKLTESDKGMDFKRLDKDGMLDLAIQQVGQTRLTPALQLAKLMKEIERLHGKFKGFRFSVELTELLENTNEWISKLTILEVPTEAPIVEMAPA